MITIEKILEKVDKLPSLSPTVAKVIQVTNNINAQPRELVTVIKMDPVLTAKVLKLVNSAYFGLSQEVASLERAVIMLGLNTIKNLALSTAVLQQFNNKKLKNLKEFDIDKFWEHSLGVAVAAKLIAIKIGIPKRNREEFFIAGLLHDIGKLILAMYFQDSLSLILQTKNETCMPLIVVENREFGITHPEIGEKIAKHWNFSEGLIQAIATHHGPNFSESSLDSFKIVMAVYIGNHYCNKNKIGWSGDDFISSLNPYCWDILGFDEDEMLKMFEVIPSELEKALDFLKVIS